MDWLLPEKNKLIMDDLTIEVVKKRAASGAAILTIRTIFLQAISFFSLALLTVFLSPAEFGVFFIVSSVKNFLSYFSDIGFAGALIQKKDKPTNIELNTVFTSQQLLVLIVLLLLFIITPLVQYVYKLNQAGTYLLWALSFSLLLSSLKTIPTVLMERRLEFNKSVIPQIVEAVIFNTIAVYLAWKGFGVTSYTVAIILSGVVSLVITYIVRPWLPSIAFSINAFKSMLRFGFPYQVNTILAMIKDDGMILFLGGVLGPSGFGVLGWAQKWAYAPLRFFMDQVIKVTFPAFSRMQDNKEELSKAVSRTVFFVCLLVFPSLVMLLFLAPVLIDVIPKYSKWAPGLFALTILSITSSLAAITTPLTNTLNAIGKIGITFKLMIMWTVLTWLFVPFLSIRYGINGAAIGFTLVGLSSFIALLIISKYISINYLQSIGKPVIVSIVLGVILYLIDLFLSASIVEVIMMIGIGALTYLLTVIAIEPSIIKVIKNIFKR